MSDNTTTNFEVYCNQLDKLSDALKAKIPELVNRKDVVFHQDNVRPHTSLITRQKLLQLERDVLSCSSYSPDLAPSDYYLFLSLQNFLNFTSKQILKNQFFACKDQKFYFQSLDRKMAKGIRSKWRILNFIKCFTK